MAFAGRLHPLLIHFPIALVIAAALAEGATIATRDARWRIIAVANVRTGAAFAVLAAAAGWQLALAPAVEPTALLEWHRWLGTLSAALTCAAALATVGANGGSERRLWTYRIGLVGAAVLVSAAGHLGGVLVWGADFWSR